MINIHSGISPSCESTTHSLHHCSRSLSRYLSVGCAHSTHFIAGPLHSVEFSRHAEHRLDGALDPWLVQLWKEVDRIHPLPGGKAPLTGLYVLSVCWCVFDWLFLCVFDWLFLCVFRTIF
jgi:hypothetical protein